jgi:ubiquinone/menaquinone biosynthesis C-methylase UbiE
MERLPAAAAEELLDQPLAYDETERSLRELDRVNRWLFGALPLRRALLPLLPRARPPAAPPLVLDLGTGSGEVAAELAGAAARRGTPVRVVGLDRKLSHLAIGRRRREGIPQLRVVGDAQALPFRDGAFAWSFSTLFFHHFDGAENLRVLAEMRRVARGGAAVIDLRRSRLLWLLVGLLVPLLGAGRVTRADGRISARRAWTLREVAELVRGLPVAELRRRFPFRFSLVLPGARRGAGPA